MAKAKNGLLILTVFMLLLAITACKGRQNLSSGGIDLNTAFASGTPVRCTLSIEGYPSQLWLGAGSYRIEASVQGKTVISVFDGSMMHSWEAESGQGVKMDVNRIQALAEELGQKQQKVGYTKEDIEQLGTNVQCYAESMQPGLFAPPAGVSFQDLTAMMENMMKATANQ